jgi:hypothetical protein
MLTTDALEALAGDLIRRAEACERLAVEYDAGGSIADSCRCEGKADAYRHAAELLRAAATTGDPVAEEREAAALLAEAVCHEHGAAAGLFVADAIRARGEVR